MAIFGKTKDNTAKVILRPRITEKASNLSGGAKPAYVFEINPKANKKMVATAIVDLYSVKPTKVNIIKTPAKKVVRRGKIGKTARLTKAVVFLKAGETIDIV